MKVEPLKYGINEMSSDREYTTGYDQGSSKDFK